MVLKYYTSQIRNAIRYSAATIAKSKSKAKSNF